MKIVELGIQFVGIAINSPLTIQVSADGETWKDLTECVSIENKEMIKELLPTGSWEEQKEFLEYKKEKLQFLVEDNIIHYRIVNSCPYCLESEQEIAAKGKFADDPYITD